MAYISYPPLGGSGSSGSGGGSATVTYPLIAPTPGAAGSEPFQFQTGGGLHGDGSGGIALSAKTFGDGLTLSTSGAVGIPGALGVTGLATLSGGLSTQAISAATATLTGNASVGGSLGVAGSAQVTGDLTARAITASAALTAASVSSQGPIAGQSLQIAGAASLGSLTVQGTFQASQIASQGTFYFPTSAANAPGLALADQHGTGVFGAPGSLGLAVAGTAVASFGSNGATQLAGSLTAGAATLQSLATSTLAVSGAASLQDAQVVTLEAQGAAQVGGNLTVAGSLSVAGSSHLANLVIDQLSTDHDLHVGGDTSLAGNLSSAGAATLQSTLTVQGATSLAGLSAGGVVLASARQLQTDSSYIPVAQVATGGTTLKYTVDLKPNGDLGLSGALTLLRGASIGGSLTSGAISAPSAALSGGLTLGAGLTAGGSLVATGPIQAALAVLGGSTLQPYAGNPNGHVSGALGDLVFDTSDGLLYIKAGGGTSNTGWASNVTTASAAAYPLLLPTSSSASQPQAAFADDPTTGIGRLSGTPLFLGVGGAVALAFASDATASFKKAVSLVAGLSVAGSTSLAGLSAGTTTLGQTTTGALTAPSATLSGALQSNSIATGGISASAITAASLAATGNGSFGGTLAAAGALTSSISAAAPRIMAGAAAISSGSGSPQGAVTGSPGDAYLETDTGSAWIKATGSATTSGWARLSTSADGTTFPLAAPDGSAANVSYGFSQGPMGITAGGANILWGVTNGAVGWSLDAQQTFAARGAVTVAGALSATGATTLQGLTATTATLSGNLSASGTLSIGGSSTLQGVTAGAISAAALTATGGVSAGAGVSSGAAVTAASSVTAGTFVKAGANQWASATTAPTGTGGAQGDLVTVSSGSYPLYVRASGGYTPVALMGQPAPSQFPLLAPLDSAGAPSFASARSPDTGIYGPAAQQLGFSTAGTQAAVVDANQKWTFAAAVAGGAATFTQGSFSGALSATGATSLGSTLQVTGAATLSSSLTAASASIAGALNAASASLSGALSAASASTTGDMAVGGNLTVAGATTYTGIQKASYVQLGDGTLSSPALAFQSETGLGVLRQAAGTLAFAAGGAATLTLAAGLATLPGALRVGGTNAGLTSPGTNTLALQTAGTTALALAASGVATFAFQAVHAAGTASLPGVGVGGTAAGLFSGTDAASNPFVGIASAGTAVARFVSKTNNSLPAYILGLGDPTSATASGGLVASAQVPSTGAPAAFPAMLYQDTRGGAAQSLWVNESTTATPAFAKVLTTSSTISASFPLLASPDGSLTAPSYAWSTEPGLGWFRSAAATMTATAAGSALATLTTNLLTLPGALRVGGTNAGVTSPGTNQLALQTAGTSALTVAATGISAFAFQAQHVAGTLAAPGIAIAAANHGVYYALVGAASTPTIGFATAGLPTGSFARYTTSGTGGASTVYQVGIGDQSSTTTTQASLGVGTLTPNGNVGANGGSIYVVNNGGVGSVWVNEGTTNNTSSWNKVLTSATTLTPTFPLLAPNGSASAPSYSFSGATSTGLTYVTDTAFGTAASVAMVAGGKVCAYTGFSTVNTLPVYNLVLGDPTTNAAPYPVAIRASAQAASGNIVGSVGQLAINNSGAAGTVLAVKETGTGTTSGWSLALTTGTTQLAAQNGTVAAPYYSFPSSTSTGLTYVSDAAFTNAPAAGIVSQGRVCGYFASSIVNTIPVYNCVLGDPTTTSSPYPAAIRATAQAAAGNIVGAVGQLAFNTTGGLGSVLAVKESSPGTTNGWNFVLTTGTTQNGLPYTQTSAPTAASGVTKVFADTAAGRINYVTSASSAAGVQPYLQPDIAATVLSASSTLTAAQNGITAVATGATQYTLTLPASAAYDQILKFQIEGTGGFKVQAPSGITIYLGNTASTSGGNVQSNAIGSFLLIANRAGSSLWIAREQLGSWTAA